MMRSPSDGKPYYCLLCDCGWDEYLACEEPDCKLESEESAQRRRAKLHRKPRRKTSEAADTLEGKQ